MGMGGQRHTPATLPPLKAPVSPCIEGWVGPRASLNGYEKCRSHRDSIFGQCSPWRVAIPTALSWPTRCIGKYEWNENLAALEGMFDSMLVYKYTKGRLNSFTAWFKMYVVYICTKCTYK